MVTADRDDGAVAGVRGVVFGVTLEEALDVPLVLDRHGRASSATTVEQRRERWGFTYWVVPDDAMEAFAPVVSAS